ncbi:FimV/HubP family polar landmark protein, partial [Xanthomonas oryzae]
AAEPQDEARATEPSERDVLQETEFEQADLRQGERAHDMQQPLSDVLRREPLLSEPAAAPAAINSDDWRALRAEPQHIAPDESPQDSARDWLQVHHADIAPTISEVPSAAPVAPIATQDSLDVDRPPVAPIAAPNTTTSRDVASAGRDRLELAVAYMDLGDKDTARGLLLEVAATGDATTRAEAAELLERLA